LTAAAGRVNLRRMRLGTLSLALVLGFAPAAGAAPSHPPAAASAKNDVARDLDTLYGRLGKTRFADEASGIVSEIDHLRLQSGSDTADLLVSRALKARQSDNWPLALKLLDSVVGLYPDWSQAWSERATARFLSGDSPGAMADVAQTLKREPRDLGALAGLAMMLLDAGEADAALKVYDRALKLAPAYEPLKEARARAQNKLWSQSP
jgi:tetratricopeptide (TPR) repeat protein